MKGISYIRVSKKREGMLTVDTQLDKINKFCDIHEIDLIDNYSDIDYSGRSANRPDFQKMLSDIENGIIDIDYVLVYKLDRFSRSVKEFYKYMTRLEDNDVNLISITQHFDTSTPMGRVMLGILINFAQFESEMTGQRIKDNLANNAERGRWNGGNVPYGYNWNEDEKLLEVDPYESKIIKMIFNKYKNGTGSTKLAELLNKRNIKTPGKSDEWEHSSIIYILRNKLYTGKIKYDGGVNEGKHKAIIDESTFNQVNQLMKSQPGNNKGNTYPLSSLTVCGKCGTYGVNTFFGTGEFHYRRYICKKRAKQTKKGCDMNAVDAGSFEEIIIKKIIALADNEIFFDKMKSNINKKKNDNHLSIRKKEIEKEIDKLNNITDKLFNDFYEKELMSEEQFEKYTDRYSNKKQKLINELEEINLQIQDNKLINDNVKFLQDNIKLLSKSWDDLTSSEKNSALKNIIKNVTFYKEKVLIDLFYDVVEVPVKHIKRGVLYF